MPEKFARPRGRPKKNTEQNQGNKKGTSRKGNYRTKYTEEKFERAMAAIRAGLSIRGAAKRYGVPYTTLNDRYSTRRAGEVHGAVQGGGVPGGEDHLAGELGIPPQQEGPHSHHQELPGSSGEAHKEQCHKIK